jgi:hypothetical protein
LSGVITSTSSDGGGVAAKKGFLFQDHIAVRHLLELLSDSTVMEVHCETRDDITVLQAFHGIEVVKNIQVKTTNNDKKWSTDELCESEIVPKQLELDNLEARSTFSIVSTRQLGSSSIKVLLYPPEQRDEVKRKQLINKINKAHKNPQSPNGNGSGYWVDNCFWEVIQEIDALKHRNTNHINGIAVGLGYNLTTSQIETVYEKLLVSVIDAAAASNKTNFQDKVFKKKEFENRFHFFMSSVSSSGHPTKHPYVSPRSISPFLLTIFKKEDQELRTGHGLDIGIENKVFRVKEFVDHLQIWLPEFCLQASEISNLPTNQLEFMSKFQDAVKRIRDNFEEEIQEVLGNLTLHSCLRMTCESEPIPCKVFYLSDNKKYKSFRNSHIVNGSTQQELWLGSSIVSDKNFVELVPECFNLVKSILDPDFLKKERRVIVDLFEPSHYSCSDVADVLDKNVPIDELSKILCVSILVIYHSKELLNKSTYEEKIKEEMELNFEALISSLPPELANVNIYIFMIPAEDIEILCNEFDKRLGG